MKLREYKVSGSGWLCVLVHHTKEWIPIVKLTTEQLDNLETGLRAISMDG